MNGLCRLCKTESELRYSHVLPEFFFLSTYDELHRVLYISEEDEQLAQKGVREYLLCQKCETKLSVYEGYAARLITQIPNFPRDPAMGCLYKDHVDYSKFKLFQLSMLWRASVSSHFAFKQVNLGPHEETVRIMLKDEKPGTSSEFGCVMMNALNSELLKRIIASPICLRPKPFGHTAYKFMTGNLSWVFFVTSHVVPDQFQYFFLQETGQIRIWIAPDDETEQLMKIGKNILEHGKQKATRS